MVDQILSWIRSRHRLRHHMPHPLQAPLPRPIQPFLHKPVTRVYPKEKKIRQPPLGVLKHTQLLSHPQLLLLLLLLLLLPQHQWTGTLHSHQLLLQSKINGARLQPRPLLWPQLVYLNRGQLSLDPAHGTRHQLRVHRHRRAQGHRGALSRAMPLTRLLPRLGISR